jgi:hypothetical protein
MQDVDDDEYTTDEYTTDEEDKVHKNFPFCIRYELSIHDEYDIHYCANIIKCGWRNYKIRQKYKEIYKLPISKYLQEDIVNIFKIRMKYPYEYEHFYKKGDYELVAAQSDVSEYIAYKSLYVTKFDLVNAIMHLTMDF